jgi:hypothetical protein
MIAIVGFHEFVSRRNAGDYGFSNQERQFNNFVGIDSAFRPLSRRRLKKNSFSSIFL